MHAGSTLAAGLGLTDLGVQGLWGRYFALGGTHTRYEVALYLSGGSDWTPAEHDLAAQVLTVFCHEHGLPDPVRYSGEI